MLVLIQSDVGASLKRRKSASFLVWKKMSIVPNETIEVTAQSMGITNLSPEVALALAPDVEYRIREIMQVHSFER